LVSVGGARASAADDAELVARLLAGDDAALAEVYDRYGGLVFGLARRVTGDEEAAREIAQDVFVGLWERPERVDLSRGSLKAYLGVIAHRRSVDAVRKSTRRGAAEQRLFHPAEAVEPSHDAQVVDAASQAWRSERLRSLVDDLPPDQRDALQLAYFGGCTYREVAEKLGIPEGTAKSRLRLALNHLRKAIDGDDLPVWTS
jgi:RNA polymerase sigma-70 factor (ECF subfamily)